MGLRMSFRMVSRRWKQCERGQKREKGLRWRKKNLYALFDMKNVFIFVAKLLKCLTIVKHDENRLKNKFMV